MGLQEYLTYMPDTGEKYDKQSIDEYIRLNEDLSGGTFSYDNAPGLIT